MAIGVYGEECISKHTVLIHDRGGVNRVHQLVDVSHIRWTRLEDATSVCEFVLAGQACGAQAGIINDCAEGARRYEVVIYRGEERVWEGPLLQVVTTRSTASFLANDVKRYLDETPLSIDWPTPSALYPMTTRIADILDYELTQEYDMRVGTGGAAHLVEVPRWEQIVPPVNIFPFIDVRPSATLYTRSDTLAFQMMVGEHLDNLADGKLSYTVVGRKLIVWDSAEAIGRTRTLTDADFTGDISVISAGSEHFSVGHVSAQRPEPADPPVAPPPGVIPGVGNAGGVNDYYGVWTTINSLDQEEGADTPSQDELNSQAQRAIVGRTPVPTEIRVPDGASLILSHDLGINELVPGTIMPILADLNIRRVAQDQRLTAVTVTETATGETIAVNLISAGDVTSVAASAP